MFFVFCITAVWIILYLQCCTSFFCTYIYLYTVCVIEILLFYFISFNYYIILPSFVVLLPTLIILIIDFPLIYILQIQSVQMDEIPDYDDLSDE